MLTIWGRLNSHNVKKVAWLAAELGLDHVRRDVGGAFGMDDAYHTLNPNGLVPTITDADGFVLWESNAILRYLAAKYGDAAWWPADPGIRALGDRWMDWQFSYADAQRASFVQLIRTPAADRNAAAIAASAQVSARLMRILDDQLADTPWLSGDRIGIGDIPMGVYTHTWMTLPIERPDLAHVARWYSGLCERRAYADTVMIPLS